MKDQAMDDMADNDEECSMEPTMDHAMDGDLDDAAPPEGNLPQDRAMAGLTADLAKEIIARMGEVGQPPEIGIEYVNVGNETALSVLEKEYLAPIKRSGRGSTFKLVQADFGCGKTHFLILVRSRAWMLGFASAIVPLSPGECPFDDQVKVFSSVVREIAWPPRDPHVLPERGLDALLRTVVEDRLEAAGETEVRAWISSQLDRASVDSRSFRTAVVRYMLAVMGGRAQEEDVLAAYLRGEDVTLAELRPLGVRERLDKTNAMRFLRSLVQVLHALGAPGLLLCFDELDRNLSFSQRRRRMICENVRELIDRCGAGSMPGLVCMYAVPPQFIRTVVPEYPALQGRLEAPASLSVRSPKSVLIDLEDLDSPPEQVLGAIGCRILSVFEVASDRTFDAAIQQANIDSLVRAVLEGTWNVAQRRTFVKAAVALLYAQMADGEHRLAPAEAAALASRADRSAETEDEDDEDDDDDFDDN